MELFNAILASVQDNDSSALVITLLIFIAITAVSLTVWLFRSGAKERKEAREERKLLMDRLQELSLSVNPEIPENAAANDLAIIEVLARVIGETGADVITLSERHNGSKSFGGGHLKYVSNTHAFPQRHISEIERVPASVFAPGFAALESEGSFCSRDISKQSVSGASNLLQDLGIKSVCAVAVEKDERPNKFLSLHFRKKVQTETKMQESLDALKLAAAEIRGITEV
jgi:hypothetical protein